MKCALGDALNIKMMATDRILPVITILIGTALSFEFNSFRDLRTALLDDNNHKFESLPYQAEDKYTESGSALKVQVRIVVADGVKSSKGDILDITTHMQAYWTDTRLSFNASSPNNNYTFAKSILKKIWTPATYLEPEWVGQNDDTRVIRIFPGGALVESKRIQTKVPCEVTHFGIRYFQLECVSKLMSYAHDLDEVNLSWDKVEPVVLTHAAVNEGQGSITGVVAGQCDWSPFQELRASCLEVKFHVSLEFSEVFVRMYVPSFMAVMMAWSSFWIHRDEASARIKLGTLVVWTVVTEYTGLDYAYPEYMRGLGGQVWMIGCLSFCWLSFFMYIVVHVVRRREKAREKREQQKIEKVKEQERKTGERAFSISDHHPDATEAKKMMGYSVWEHKALTKFRLNLSSFQVDRLCRIWFMIAFAAFNTGFWVYFKVKQ